MNATNGMFKGETKHGNYQKQLVFLAKSCAHFQNSRVYSSMTTKSATKKLQRITRAKEA